jgi:hypothetical protein
MFGRINLDEKVLSSESTRKFSIKPVETELDLYSEICAAAAHRGPYPPVVLAAAN